MNVPSLIRTYVPLGLSVFFGWLVSLGVNVSDEAKAALTSGIGAVLAAVYYAVVRVIERRFPWATVLLGSTQQPVAYAPSPDAVPTVDVVAVQSVSDAYGDLAPLPDDELAPLQDESVGDEPEPSSGRHAADV